MRQQAPWVGLRPFGKDDEYRFFGRASEIHAVTELWQRNRLTLLTGDSGVGKTSLLHAGVFPQVRNAGAHVLPIGDLEYRQTLPAPLIPARSPDLFTLLAAWRPVLPPAGCLGLTVRNLLGAVARLDAAGGPLPTLVAIDGADRILRGAGASDPRHRRFLDELADGLAHRPEVHLLLSVRTDSLAGVGYLADALGQRPEYFELGPLDRNSAIDALSKPLASGSFRFEAGVPAQLVDALRAVRSGVTPGETDPASVDPPLLQVLCTALWERLTASERPARTITSAMIPDVDRTLADFCTRTLAALTTDHNLPTCEIGTWLRRTFIDPAGAARAVRQSERPPEIGEPVAGAAEDRRLIKACRLDGVDCYQLQHPRLVAALQRLGEAQGAVRPDSPADQLREAERAMSVRNLDLAGRLAEAAATRSAESEDGRIQAQAHLILAEVAFARAEHEVAIRAYESAISLFGSAPGTTSLGHLFAAIARLQLLQGRPSDALEQIRVASVFGASEIVVKLELVQAHWHSDRPRQAMKELNRILAKDAGHVEALRIRGEMHADAGNAAAALDDLERIRIAAQPSASAARILALAAGPGVQPAQAELDRLLDEAIDHGLVLLSVARVMKLRGERDNSIRLATNALNATNPRLADYHRREAEKLSRGR